MVQSKAFQIKLNRREYVKEINRLYESCKKLDYLIKKLDFLINEIKTGAKK